MDDASPRGVLLTNGSYYGTLAAARHFGRNGYRVSVADPSTRNIARLSRYVSEYHRCPERLDFEGMLAWLLDYGSRRPGELLYPCSDDLAWMLAQHRDQLEPHFCMLQPDLATIESLLDKEQLYGRCATLGIPTPLTHFPRDDEHLSAIVGGLQGMYIVKPKTQVGLSVNRKGEVALAGPELVAAYRRFRRQVRYTRSLDTRNRRLQWPMLQAFNPSAATHTTSLAGFSAPDTQTLHVLSSRKSLQYPLRIGVGLCFESIPANPILIDYVRRLCRDTGYFGAFEAEFVQDGDRYELIDFNPRFYGQMQLEISRGLPIPALVAAAAEGRPLPEIGPFQPGRLANRSLLELIMTTQWLAGRLSKAERQRWLDFASEPGIPVSDHVMDADDRAPQWADSALRLAGYLRHPRAALRTLFGSQ